MRRSIRMAIVTGICAAGIIASASLSWGVQVSADNQVDNFLFSPNVTFTNIGSSLSSTQTLGAAPPISESLSNTGSYSPNVDASLSSTLPIAANGGSSSDALSWVNAGPNLTPGATTDAVYLSASGSVSALTPEVAGLTSHATFTQAFTVATVGTVSVSADAHPFFDYFLTGASWDTAKLTSVKFRNIFTLISDDVTVGVNGIQSVDTGWYGYFSPQAGNNTLLVSQLFSANVIAGGTYGVESFIDISAAATVPEPGTFVLAGSGLLGLFLLRRRSNKSA